MKSVREPLLYWILDNATFCFWRLPLYIRIVLLLCLPGTTSGPKCSARCTLQSRQSANVAYDNGTALQFTTFCSSFFCTLENTLFAIDKVTLFKTVLYSGYLALHQKQIYNALPDQIYLLLSFILNSWNFYLFKFKPHNPCLDTG